MDKRVTLKHTATFATNKQEHDQHCNFNVHVKIAEMWNAETGAYEKPVHYARLFNSTFSYDKIFMNFDALEQTIAHLKQYGVTHRS